MKLLFLCKQRPQGKNLLDRPYGRFYYLPKIFAENGFDVHVLLLNYKSEPKTTHKKRDSVHWVSISLIRNTPFCYYREACKISRKLKPDWIIGFSDTYYGILAQHLAHRFGCKSMIDAYDNYESYLPWCKPLHYLWRRALSKADLVTAAGPQLAQLMGQERPDKPTVIVPMAADPTGFEPLDKIKCRQELGLPPDKELIGYCGAIYANRDIEILFDAYKILRQQHKNIELVLSGRKESGISIPENARWLGYIPDKQVPVLLNSMDVLTVINKTSSFGNYSYPVKLYEAMCCQVPVVATSTQTTKWILRKYQDCLCRTNDSDDLSVKIMHAMKHEKINYDKQQGWEDEVALLEETLVQISQQK